MSDDSQGNGQGPANLQALEAQFGADIAKDLVLAYLEDTDQLLEKMQEAIHGRNVKALKPLAHMVKSAAGIVGANELSKISMQMEAMCVEGQNQWLTIETSFEKWTVAFEATNDFLRQYLQ